MKAERYILNYLNTSLRTLAKLGGKEMLTSISRAGEEMLKCYFKKGGVVYLLGNGGGATIAQHLAEELTGGFKIFGPKRVPLPAQALSVDGAKITAIANEFGFDQIFARQLEPVLTGADVVIAISAGGNSANVLKVVELANQRQALTIGLTGKSGGRLAKVCKIMINVPTDEISIIREGQMLIAHALGAVVEEGLFGKELLVFD